MQAIVLTTNLLYLCKIIWLVNVSRLIDFFFDGTALHCTTQGLEKERSGRITNDVIVVTDTEAITSLERDGILRNSVGIEQCIIQKVAFQARL